MRRCAVAKTAKIGENLKILTKKKKTNEKLKRRNTRGCAKESAIFQILTKKQKNEGKVKTQK
jgi:hypothetical protein